MQLLTESHEPIIEDAREVIWPYLVEGVFDPYILKAVFMAGGGGSGKGFISNAMFGTVANMATTAVGLKSLNSDDLLTALTGNLDIQLRPTGAVAGRPGAAVDVMQKGLGGRSHMDLGTQLGHINIQRKGGLRDQAKRLRGKRENLFIRGRLGLIIDGTAAKVEKLLIQKKKLEAAGYDCSMVFVDTSLEVALERNRNRMRRVPEKLVIGAHAKVQAASKKFEAAFRGKFARVDNSKRVPPKQQIAVLVPQLHKIMMRFIATPLKNPKGWAWLRDQTEGMPKSMLKKVTWIGKKRGV